MAWFMTPHGPQSVVEPATITEFRRRDYLEITAQQAADFFAGAAEIPDVSFITGQELAAALVGVDPLATDSTRLGRWRYGLASRQPRAFILNDSWGDGNGASDWQHAWVRRFARRLRDTYFPGATAGTTYVTPGSSIHAATAPITYTFSGAADVDYMGIQRRMRHMNTGNSTTFTFTGTGFDIHYGTPGTAMSYTYAIDGATAVTVNQASVGGEHSEHPEFRTQVRGLSAASHTVVLTAVTDSFFLLGVMAYNGDETNGVRVYEGGRGSTGTQYWTTESYRWMPEVATIDPHLVVIALGINDFQESTNKITSAQFKTNLAALIADFRANLTNDPSIVLAVPPAPTGTGLSPWAEFPAAIRAVAAADGQVAVFDSTAVLGSSIATSGANPWGYFVDGFHINDAGHQAYADSLFEVVTRFP